MICFLSLLVLLVSEALAIITYQKHKVKNTNGSLRNFLSSLLAFLLGIIGIIAYCKCEGFSNSNLPSVINNTTINNYYPITRDSVINSKLIEHTQFSSAQTSVETSFVGEKIIVQLPPEPRVEVSAHAFIFVLNAGDHKFNFAYSKNLSDSLMTFSCKDIGLKNLKIYGFIDNKFSNEINVQLELRDPNDYCRVNG